MIYGVINGVVPYNFTRPSLEGMLYKYGVPTKSILRLSIRSFGVLVRQL